MFPLLSAHPPRVRGLIQRLKTPFQVQWWLRSLRYNPKDTMRTLDQVVAHQSAHCLEAALAAATILEYHGYPPLILDLESADLLDHTLFVFQNRGKHGSVGKSRDVGLDGRKPIFRTLRDLAKSYAIPYIDEQAAIESFGLLDLRTLRRGDWRTSKRQVWYVEQSLRNIPHRHLPTSSVRVQSWREQYRQWRQQHPTKQPSYFPGQGHWW